MGRAMLGPWWHPDADSYYGNLDEYDYEVDAQLERENDLVEEEDLFEGMD